jgi:hypothetical protein
MKVNRILFFILIGVTAFPITSAQAGGSQTAQTANRLPSIILMMRHAEKPAPEEKSSDLSPVGYRRAELLPTLFLPTGSQTARFPIPDVLFATAMSKHSNREVETLLPLSKKLHLPINNDFSDDEIGPISKEILSGKYAGKIVLICWHHGRMPDLAHALGATEAPSKIEDSVFDQMWRIEWLHGQEEFSIIPEALLPGDHTK